MFFISLCLWIPPLCQPKHVSYCNHFGLDIVYFHFFCFLSFHSFFHHIFPCLAAFPSPAAIQFPVCGMASSSLRCHQPSILSGKHFYCGISRHELHQATHGEETYVQPIFCKFLCVRVFLNNHKKMKDYQNVEIRGFYETLLHKTHDVQNYVKQKPCSDMQFLNREFWLEVSDKISPKLFKAKRSIWELGMGRSRNSDKYRISKEFYICSRYYFHILMSTQVAVP